VLLRLAYLAVTSLFSLIQLFPHSDVDKNLGILALRQQLAILRRQVHKPQPGHHGPRVPAPTPAAPTAAVAPDAPVRQRNWQI
jgi:hypothetical protein